MASLVTTTVAGTVTINQGASGMGMTFTTPSTGQNSWIIWKDGGTTNKWEIGKNTTNKLYIHNYAASESALEFDAASHATFGGQVTFTDDLYITSSQNIHWSGNYSFITGNGANTTGFLKFYTSDTLRLTIAGGGAATFSGNVTLNSSLTFSYNNYYFEAGTGSIYLKNAGGNTVLGMKDAELVVPGVATVSGNIVGGGFLTLPNTYGLTWGDLTNRIEGHSTNNTVDIYTNNAFSMRINGDGNVGIGTNGPLTKTHIHTAGAAIAGGNAIKSSTMKGLSITNSTNDTSSVGIWFGTNASHWAGISAQRESTSTWGTDLRFYTHEDNTQNLTYASERMRIDPHGNVGIGTNNPGQLLEVGNDGNSDYALIGPTKIGGGMGHGDYAGFSHRSMGGTSNYCLLQYSDGNTYLNAASGKTIHLRVNNSNILKVTGSLATFDVGALFNGYIELDAGLKDKDGSFGTNGYVLTTDGSGDVTWAASPGAGSVTGTGTNNYIASWNGTTALETANIYKHAYGTIINSNFLSSYATNRHVFEVAGNPGTGDFDGGIINLRVASNTNNERVGQLAFINSANANHVNPNSTIGSRIAQIISTVATSDSNAGDDSGGDLQFWTKPEAGVPAERMRIQYDGKVGINATSPMKRLDVRWSSSDTTVATGNGLSGGSAGEGMLLLNTYNGTGIYANLDFRAYDADARIAVERTTSGNQSNMHFITDNSSNFDTRMFIQYDGNVGIGTVTSPVLLSVSGTNPAIDLMEGATSRFRAELGSNITYLSTIGAYDMVLRTGQTAALTLSGSNQYATFSGNVTLATGGSAAAPRLAFGDGNTGFFESGDNDLYITIGGTQSFIIEENSFYGANATGAKMRGNIAASATTASFCFNSDSDTGIGRADANKLSLVAGGVGTATVTATGFGIGTTAPGTKLEIIQNGAFASGQSVALQIASALQAFGGNNDMRLYFHEAGTTYRGMMGYAHAGSTYMGIWDNSSNLNPTLVCQSGEVGIGTTAPGKKLHVYSGASGVGASSDVNMILEGASNVGLAMLAPNNQGSRIEFGSVADNNEGIIYYNNTGSYFSIYTNGTRQVDITSAGNVGIGQAAPRNPLEVDLNQSNGTLTGDSAAHFGGPHHTSGEIMGITLGYREANDSYRKVGIVAAGLGDGAARQDFHILVNTANSAASCSLADKKLSIYGTTGIIRVHNKFGIGGDPGAHHLYAAGSAFITGSVGIGTATPAEKLDVNGNIMTTGASTNTGYDRYLKLYGNTQPASNPHRWAGMAVYNNGGNNVNALAFFTGTGDSARTEKVRIHNDGKVGIGSTTPIRQLDVLGAVAGQYSAALINTSATGHGLYIKAAPNSASYMALAVDDKDGATILVARGDKRVGIGTNAPTKMLEVEGSEAEIRVHDTYSNTNNTLLSIGSDLHNTNTKDSWIKFLGGNATNDRSWAIGNRASGFFNFTYIGTRATLPSTGGGNVPLVLDGINNRVGIGTDAPDSLGLNIASASTDPTASYTGNSQLVIGLVGSTTHKLAISRDTDGNNAYIHSYQDGVGAKNLILQPGGGKIGIVETAPVSGLVVRTDDVDATPSANVSQYSLNIHGNGVSDGEEIGLAFSAWASGGSLTTSYTPGAAIVHERSGSNSKGHLHFRVKGSTTANATLTTAMTILDNGNVGIGIASPAAALHVAPDNNNNDGAIKVGARAWFSHSDGGQTHTWVANDYNSDASQFGIRMKGVAESNEVFTVLGNGNVGIGTASPAGPLHVYDDYAGERNLYFDNHNASGVMQLNIRAGTGNEYLSLVRTTTSASLLVATDPFYIKHYHSSAWHNSIVVAADGKIGMGTSSPDNPLEVVGADSGIKISAASSNRPQLRLECGTTEKMIFSANSLYGAIGDSSDLNRYMAFKDGKVGIGETSPGYKLTVNGDFKVESDATFDGSVYVRNANNNAILLGKGTRWGYSTAYRAVQIGDASGNHTVCIGYDPAGNSGSSFTGDGREMLFRNGITFVTPNAGNTNWHHTLTLKDGLVGIGDTSPDYKLDVDGTFGASGAATFAGSVTANSTLSVGDNFTAIGDCQLGNSYSDSHTVYGQTTFLEEGNEADNIYLRNTTNGGKASIRFGDHATQGQSGYFRYAHSDSHSNGTANSFHFDSSETSTAVIIDQTTGDSGFYVGDGTTLGNTNYMVALRGNNDSYLMGGDVGIGTRSPSRKFDVYDGNARIFQQTATAELLIGSGGTGAAALILDASNGDGAGADYFYIQQNNDLTTDIGTASSGGVVKLRSKGSLAQTLDGTKTTFGGVVVLGNVQSSINPLTDSTYDIGSNTGRWANVFADTLYGAGSNITSLNATNISSGTLNASRLATSGATAASYTNANITIDNKGRVTAASNGSGGGGGMTDWKAVDGDGTSVTVSNDKYLKFKESTGININLTDTSTGSSGDPFDMTFNVTGGVCMSISKNSAAGSYINPSSNNFVFTEGTGIQLAFSGSEITFSSGTSSDYRLKKNISTFNSEAWTKVKSVNLRKFDFDEDAFKVAIDSPDKEIDSEPKDYTDNLGFIAHELAAAGIKGAVIGDKDAVDEDGNFIYQKVNYISLVPVLWGALNESISKIETLETKVQALEDK